MSFDKGKIYWKKEGNYIYMAAKPANENDVNSSGWYKYENDKADMLRKLRGISETDNSTVTGAASGAGAGAGLVAAVSDVTTSVVGSMGGKKRKYTKRRTSKKNRMTRKNRI